MLTAVPFSVPFTSTVNVSGGGGALNAAVAAAPAGTRLLITDSLTYSKAIFTAKTNITIEAASGQTPVIQAAPGFPSGNCLVIAAGNSGIRVKGISFLGNGNQNPFSQLDNGLIIGSNVTGMSASTFDRLIVEDCTFNELNPTAGVPGIQLVGSNGLGHDNVQIIRCTFTDMATPPMATLSGYGAVTIGGFNHVYIQNCLIQRSAVARASSNMRGVVIKNLSTVIEDVLCRDIGSAGENEAFKHTDAGGIFGSAVGSSSFRNCVVYNAKQAYRITLAGASMAVSRSVGDNDVAGIAAGQIFVNQSAGSLSVTDSVFTGAGDGTAFSAAVAVENHNDVFNFAANGKVLDATDITVDPVYEDVPNGDFLATAAACQTAASDGGLVGIRYQAGEKIIWCNH